MKRRHSLLAKYLIIIVFALVLIPISIPTISILYYTSMESIHGGDEYLYKNGTDLEKMWHEEASALRSSTKEEIMTTLQSLHDAYKEAAIFWVDEHGKKQWQSSNSKDIPSIWDAAETVAFMKKSYNGDPFTVVAFVGEDKNNGFMVFQLPRKYLDYEGKTMVERYSKLMIVTILFILLLFIFFSWLFFNRIRKRLLRLQLVMEDRSDDGIPEHVLVDKTDEIGQLESSFNRMVDQLEESRRREQEEEQLRRELIANLSHDLRTPLTTLRGHASVLKKEPLTENGKQTLAALDLKVTYLGDLIDNLQSYTLLKAGKYPFHPQKTDVVRLVRQVSASWYPLFEKEAFVVDIDLPNEKVEWIIDIQWFERVLDNFFQNIYRHARGGKYIRIGMEKTVNGRQLCIEDHGPGFKQTSKNKGAGIGLSIVSLMLKEMSLAWEITSTKKGTLITIMEAH
ncbi:HAMP domain-containing sensor histidine kinase [Bacillus chungangensis]|uniref:histidine kinase n=1 Tax=Bacillus chungangensis TaxID=587633 RepID=A0ABT9WQ19_9BACI|nr:HAMP domain-containing sensor histidine kinase [Bacillus chungangensis]MDQ0175317.1 signal transduction histidine kinase [Bacillus chungangensis]